LQLSPRTMRRESFTSVLPQSARAHLAALTAWVAQVPDLSFYAVGSATTGEGCWSSDARSDVDLLLVTDEPPEPAFINEAHVRVRDHPDARFGVRIRTAAELNHFGRRMSSWGYDLRADAVWLFGPPREFPPTPASVPFGWVVNNWLERLWLNARKAAVTDGVPHERFWAGLALDALMLDQIRRGILGFRHRQRVSEAAITADGERLQGMFAVKTGQAAALRRGDVEWVVRYTASRFVEAWTDLRKGRPLEAFSETSFGQYEQLRPHVTFLSAINRAYLDRRGEPYLRAAGNALAGLERAVLGSEDLPPRDPAEAVWRYAAVRMAAEPLTERDHGWSFRRAMRSRSMAIPAARASAVAAK
jgi:hypothetical protein